MINARQEGSSCYIGIDLGTTTTRVWLVAEGNPVHRLTDSVGVRDSARDGNNDRLKETLRELIQRQQSKAAELGIVPEFVIGAGMLTSALGLKEIPHLHGPVGVDDLRRGILTWNFPEVTSLPVRLVPGVKTGVSGTNAWEIGDTDVIRGEETLCAGLLALEAMNPDTMFLNLGSHWKAILLDEQGRISRCASTLSGELMFVAQMHTVLASSMPPERPIQLDEAWVQHGMNEERKSGLVRALFCVRLLELEARTTAAERQAFLVGCFISQTLSALISKGFVRNRVVICGAEGISKAWKFALEKHGMQAEEFSDRTEGAFIRGLSVLSQSVQEFASA